MTKYLVYYGGKDIDIFEAESEEEAVEMCKESDSFYAEVEEER
jgi:hypothetical protein